MPTVVLVGTLDTKGADYDFVRNRLRALGCDVILVDAGVLGQPMVPVDVTREEVARVAQVDLADLVARNDRGLAIEAMASGVEAVVQYLLADGRVHGILGLGGSGGTSLIVSTVASGEVGKYVGEVDTGWQTMRLLALYNPGGAEHALESLPDFQELPAGQQLAWQ